MSERDVEVIQGRLGWERGDVSEAKPSEIKPHPKNREIYGDTENVDDLDQTFVESVREKGVLEPIVITEGKEIISGHRRWLAAKNANVDRVPVRYAEFDSELAEREALIEFNRQREKTPGQIVNEAEELLEIEKRRGKQKQGKRTDISDNSRKSKSENGGHDSWEKVAEKVGVSDYSLRQGKQVKDKATSDDEPEAVREAAQEAWEDLQSGDESFNGAHERVKKAESEENGESDGHDLNILTSQETDEWSSPRELVEPLAKAIGGFDLDPSSGAEKSPFADNTYTEAENGLKQPWEGNVWVNPPYSEMGNWTEKTITEAQREETDTICYLSKGDSSTDWWQSAAGEANLLCAIDHRLQFGDGENSAPFASHIFVFGNVQCELANELANQGALLTVGWQNE